MCVRSLIVYRGRKTPRGQGPIGRPRFADHAPVACQSAQTVRGAAAISELSKLSTKKPPRASGLSAGGN